MDRLYKYLNEKDTIRVFAVNSTEMLREALRIHAFSPTAAAAVGRAMTAAAIMAAERKDAANITLNIKGDGPAGGLCVVARPGVNVKAYVENPQADVPPSAPGKLNVGALIGSGRLSVVKDLRMREPWVGQVELVSGEIGDDIAQYYMQSEQQPSLVALGVLVNAEGIAACGGIVAQPLPGCPDEDIDQLERCAARLGHISSMIAQKDITEVAAEVFAELELREIEQMPVNYNCDCSRERMENALIALGKKELASLIESGEETEICCHFCNSAYKFNNDEMMALLTEAMGGKHA